MSKPVQPSTKERQVAELLKCGTDPAYFIDRYVKIQHAVKGAIPFKLYDFQRRVLDDLVNERYNIILKSRQLGITTLISAYSLWLALFHRDKNIVCIATKLDTALEFLSKVKYALQHLPQWMLLKPIITETRQHIVFGNGSQIRSIPRSESAGRGMATSLLIIDEAAHIEGFDRLWMSLLPTLSTGGSTIICSTPNGATGAFYKTYVDAINGDNNFNPIKLPWHVHPERDEKWERETRQNFSPEQFAQEYDCSFLGSGKTFIAPDDIEWYRQNMRSPLRREGPANGLWVWEDPHPDHEYVISADVARGDPSGDFSAAHVFDTTTSTVVAEFMARVRPDAFGKFLDGLGRRYNNALMAVERNTYGHHTLTVLMHRDYPNLWYEQMLQDPNYIPDPDDIPGYSMTGRDKRANLLLNMEEIIRNRLVRVYSERLVAQMQSFIWTTKRGSMRAAAKKGQHDDLIMSFAIGVKVFSPNAEHDDVDATPMHMAMATVKVSSPFNIDRAPTQPDIEGVVTQYDHPAMRHSALNIARPNTGVFGQPALERLMARYRWLL